MRVSTRSKSITKAIDWVLWRMPPKDREVVERFVFRVTAARAWTPIGTGIDPTSAMLAPFWKATSVGAKYDRQARGALRRERTSAGYDAQVCFNLPVVRLFSDNALVGIVAHEFAHARIAARLGEWWNEKMKAHLQSHERAADRLASSWGFGKEIRLMRQERDETVTAILYSREHEIRQATQSQSARHERRERLLMDQYDRAP
jgi:hypothetical protein